MINFRLSFFLCRKTKNNIWCLVRKNIKYYEIKIVNINFTSGF